MAVTCTTTIDEATGIPVLRVEGRLDAVAVADFSAALMPLAGDAAVKRVVLDCGGLVFVASAGLRVFIAAVKMLKPRGAQLYTAAVAFDIAAVFKMTGLHSLMTMKETVGECLA
jgi:anti-anti-sigma factor